MATQRRRLLFRNLIFVALVLGIIGGSVYAFWPKPIAVETQLLERGPGDLYCHRPTCRALDPCDG